MKKISIFFAIALFFIATSTVNAESDDYKRFYVGAGGSYGIENFDGGGDFENSWGINAKLGYHLIDEIAVQFDYDYLWGFDDNDKIEIFGDNFEGETELDIMTFILSLKGNFPVKWYQVISPYIIAGGGIMHADADFKIRGPGISGNSSTDETDFCGKIGGGFDFFLHENFSVNLEGNYTFGFDDLEDIQYFHFILGGVFHFDLPYGNHKF
ncbi:MAG: porin family protein [Desulfobacterales bacterium]|jgi:opacity protein-like surface antigen|nr:porin family protein [Desulfobacterales bacterium]